MNYLKRGNCMFCKLWLNKVWGLNILSQSTMYLILQSSNQEGLITELPPADVLGPQETLIKAIRDWATIFIFTPPYINCFFSHCKLSLIPASHVAQSWNNHRMVWTLHCVGKICGAGHIRCVHTCSWKVMLLLRPGLLGKPTE